MFFIIPYFSSKHNSQFALKYDPISVESALSKSLPKVYDKKVWKTLGGFCDLSSLCCHSYNGEASRRG